MDDISPGQIVSATALIRHFAAHSRQALIQPVHIMNHGHVSLSLISTELFLRLSNGQQTVSGDDQLAARLDILLDTIATEIILTDQNLNLLRVNLAARKRMEVVEEKIRGAPVAQLLAGPAHHFSLRALQRVRDTGIAEEFDISSPGHGALVQRIRVMSYPGGFALLADDITDRVTLREQDARIMAYENLIDALPGLARGVFNIRGMVTNMSPALARMIETDESRIIGVRFATLFDASNRGAIGDSVESLLTSGKPFSMAAGLVSSNARSKSVWVNAAPLLSADGQAGGVFLIGDDPQAGSINS